MTHTLKTIRSTIYRGVAVMALLAPTYACAQLYTWSKQELIDYTTKSPFGRLADGRPKVPDAMIERARDLSSEEVWESLPEHGFRNQYADGFQVLHPGKTMVGRAFTVQFMPCEPTWMKSQRTRRKSAVCRTSRIKLRSICFNPETCSW